MCLRDRYPDYASWFNANETVNGLKFLSIGNVEGGLPGAGGFVAVSYTHLI